MSKSLRKAQGELCAAYAAHLDRELNRKRRECAERVVRAGVGGSVVIFDRAYPFSSPRVRAAELRMLADAEGGGKC